MLHLLSHSSRECLGDVETSEIPSQGKNFGHLDEKTKRQKAEIKANPAKYRAKRNIPEQVQK